MVLIMVMENNYQEVEKFVKQSNNVLRKMNANRVAKYRKMTLWRHSK